MQLTQSQMKLFLAVQREKKITTNNVAHVLLMAKESEFLHSKGFIKTVIIRGVECIAITSKGEVFWHALYWRLRVSLQLGNEPTLEQFVEEASFIKMTKRSGGTWVSNHVTHSNKFSRDKAREKKLSNV